MSDPKKGVFIAEGTRPLLQLFERISLRGFQFICSYLPDLQKSFRNRDTLWHFLHSFIYLFIHSFIFTKKLFGAILRLVAVLLLCFCDLLPGHAQTRTSKHLLPKTTPSPVSAGRPRLRNFGWVSPAKCEASSFQIKHTDSECEIQFSKYSTQMIQIAK